MNKRQLDNGFSTVEIVLVVVVVALLGFGGWFVWHGQQKDKATVNKQTDNSATTGSAKLADGWIYYSNKDLGIKFAHPNNWTISDPRIVKTAKGESGIEVVVEASDEQKGDPAATLTTYPKDASISDVDAGPKDFKIQDLSNADNKTFTVVGIVDQPSTVTGATRLNVSSCWPRYCVPTMKNGSYLLVAVSASGNDCTKPSGCDTSINTSSKNYKDFVKILESTESL